MADGEGEDTAAPAPVQPYSDSGVPDATDQEIADVLHPAGAADQAPPANPAQWNSFLDPALATAAAQSTPTGSSSQRTKIGTDVSYHGLPPDVNARGDYARADRAAAQESAALGKDRQAELDAITKDYAAKNAAVQEAATAEQAHFDLTKGILERQRTYQLAQAELEKQAYAESRATSQKLLGQYEEQLAGVKALTAQSGNPINGLSTGERVGLVGAMFAQGFLAARGIHIDVAGQVDRWIDRGIQEHQLAIQNARQDAQDTLHLYDIARQTSNDDYEARQRFRGFVLQGFATQVEMEAARFGSQAAAARAKGVIADAQLELDKTKSALTDRWFTQDFQIKQQKINEVHMQHQDEMETLRSRADLLRAQAEANRAAKANQPVGQQFYSDPGDVLRDKTGNVTSGGKFKWFLRQDMPKEITTKAAEAADKATKGYADLADSLDRLRQLRAAVGKMGGPDVLKQIPEAYRLYNQQKSLIAASIKRGMEGLRGSDKDQELYAGLLADDSWLQEGTNAKQLDNLGEWGREHYEHEMNNTTGIGKLADRGAPLPDSPYASSETADPGQKALGDLVMKSPAPTTDPIQAAEAKLTGINRRSDRVTVGQKGSASQMLVDYLNQQAQANDDVTLQPEHFLPANGYREEYRTVDFMARAALRPDSIKSDKSPEETRAEAINDLRMVADGHMTDGSDVPKEASDYARFVLGRIDSRLNDQWAGAQGNSARDLAQDEDYLSLNPSVDYTSTHLAPTR